MDTTVQRIDPPVGLLGPQERGKYRADAQGYEQQAHPCGPVVAMLMYLKYPAAAATIT